MVGDCCGVCRFCFCCVGDVLCLGENDLVLGYWCGCDDIGVGGLRYDVGNFVFCVIDFSGGVFVGWLGCVESKFFFWGYLFYGYRSVFVVRCG